ncbi:MAG: glycosyltransferase family 4 protein [Sedimentisphaerales bacterium]|nr:glycosyltransferase family 4 protein [Sedimentisphaerales bacterium]
MRMLYLYFGRNSGTNQAVLDAWRAGSPDVEITACDPYVPALQGVRSKVGALSHALRRGGIETIVPGRGRFMDAVRRSGWCMERVAGQVARLQQSDRFDFSLAIGTVVPNLKPAQPHFIYTDLTIRANAYYPQGQERLKLWEECIAYEEDSLRKASLVFTMSEHVTRSLVEQYAVPHERVVRVNGGCNAPLVEVADDSRYEQMNVLFVGVDWERKGGPQLVEALARIRTRRPRATLTIVGCSPHVSGPGIRVVGPVSQQEVSNHMADATCFCMPSRREPFGIVYIEAMHAGLPVVASDLGATPDFVINGCTGYRVDPDNIDELAGRLDELLSDPDKCRRMGKQARTLAQSQYTWERTQQKMHQAIRGVLVPSKEREGISCG